MYTLIYQFIKNKKEGKISMDVSDSIFSILDIRKDILALIT